MTIKTFSRTAVLVMAGLVTAHTAHAAIALDRTRVIFNGSQGAESLSITNQNKNLPYLAQAWIENAEGLKIESPLMALPPLQRIEPGSKSQVKLQANGASALRQDQETLYYFNLREIPPKSKKPNTLQIALQTRVKLFYRPAALAVKSGDIPQKKLTLTKTGDHYVVHNPTGYYVTFVHASSSEKADNVPGFKVDMVPPKGELTLGGSATALGMHPVLTYINDFGGRPKLIFSCSSNTCSVTDTRVG